VYLRELRLRNLRNVVAVDIELEPGVAVFLGANGAGKTSILEGAHLLSHAQSFRSTDPDGLIRRGCAELSVYAEVIRALGPVRLGLARRDGRWEAMIQGGRASSLGALLHEFALVCFEPGSHALISGASRLRRRFLDWGVFHVEPDHWRQARRYQRALRQRNAWLRRPGIAAELEAWDTEVAEAGEALAVARADYFDRFAAQLREVLWLFLPELGEGRAELQRGWADGMTLAEALRRARAQDQRRGHSTVGPHRADWSIAFSAAPSREQLSRGQEKLCALACTLAQARLYATERSDWPVIALDDFQSELDQAHQAAVVRFLESGPQQVLVSGIEMPESLRRLSPLRVFHVEHGHVRSLL
jgi:DNA replication and repair protein RecF